MTTTKKTAQKEKTEILSPALFCPIRQTLKLLGKRWTILIVKEIHFSPKNKLSFMELRRLLVDVSTKVLSERLKEMAKEGMLTRKVHPNTTPVRVYYSLTEKGKDACKIVMDMKEYGLKWGDNQTTDCGDLDCEICVKQRLN